MLENKKKTIVKPLQALVITTDGQLHPYDDTRPYEASGAPMMEEPAKLLDDEPKPRSEKRQEARQKQLDLEAVWSSSPPLALTEGKPVLLGGLPGQPDPGSDGENQLAI